MHEQTQLRVLLQEALEPEELVAVLNQAAELSFGAFCGLYVKHPTGTVDFVLRFRILLGIKLLMAAMHSV